MIQRKVSIILENKPGALVRVVGLFHQRGYNIESLHVDPVNDLTEYKYVEKNLNIKLKKGEVSHLIISTTVNDNLLTPCLLKSYSTLGNNSKNASNYYWLRITGPCSC